MRTGGIDLASRNLRTAACVLEWPDSDKGSVVSLEIGVSDARILEIAETVQKLGIDVPLGWPRKFARAVATHSSTGRWDPGYDHGADAVEYRLRATDRYVKKATRSATHAGVIPLSVSTDRIGIPAMRAAALVSRLERGVRLDGSGKVIEAYPAGALVRWGFAPRQYKGAGEANRARRAALVAQFCDAAQPSLVVGDEFRRACIASDDAFDALVAACIARAAAIGAVKPIPRAHRKDARREGWIALPKRRALERLAGAGAARPLTPRRSGA